MPNPRDGRPTTTPSTTAPSPTPPPAGALERAMPVGAITRPQNLAADVSGELAETLPSFGNVLRAIGSGVATSQVALDRGVIATVNTLRNTNVTVVTEVIEVLDDDGLPNLEQTQLVTQDVSVLNFVTPTVHEWRHVALSMDLEVGAVDREQGIVFSRRQRSLGASTYGLFWGFVGWGTMWDNTRTDSAQQSTRLESDWAQGSVRVDAMLRPRATKPLPAATRVSRGPEMFFSQGAIQETEVNDVVTARAVDLTITVRKADGSVNPNVNLVVDGGNLLLSFASTSGFTGSTTNAQGQVRVNLRRNIPNPVFSAPVRFRVTSTLGQITRTHDVRL